MKYLYLFFIYLLVNSDCPNLCSGHGTCSSNGKCVCNTQPGLGLNKGAFDEFSWTGADCSLRTCPKGQSFSYDIFKTTPDHDANLENLKFIKELIKKGNEPRLLFESDNGRQAAGDNADNDDSTTPDDGKVDPTTKPTTKAPTTAGPTTTTPEIITKPPIIVTPPPINTLPEKEKDNDINKNSLVVNSTTVFDKNDTVSSEVIIFNEKTGEIIGKVTVDYTDKNKIEYPTLEDVFNQLGIVDVTNIKIAEKPKSYAETSPTINFASTPIVTKVKDSTGKAIDGVAYTVTQGMRNKLNSLYKSKTTAPPGRMLVENPITCGQTSILNGGTTKMWCIESENPKDNNFFKMKLLELELQCLNTKDDPNPTTCNGDRTNCDVYVAGPASELEDINSACFYLGSKDAKIEDSDIFSLVGERGGDYYFTKYTEGSTVILATLIENEDGDYVINYKESPSLVSGKSYSINRPIGDLQKSIIPGGKMIYTPYDPTTGSLGTSQTITIDKGGINGKGELVIEIPKAVDMNATSPDPDDNDGPTSEGSTSNPDEGSDSTGEEGTSAGGRRLWDERELKDGDKIDVGIFQFVEYAPHAFIECSGQGNCNRETGQCECYEGFEGDACQRTSCPNNCNNNGRCVVLTEALGYDIKEVWSGPKPTPSTEFTQSVSEPFDSKIFGCICDEGHRGPDCSLYECPSDEDPSKATNLVEGDEYRDCSGRGICDYKTGTCNCFDGYYGTACEGMASFS